MFVSSPTSQAALSPCCPAACSLCTMSSAMSAGANLIGLSESGNGVSFLIERGADERNCTQRVVVYLISSELKYQPAHDSGSGHLLAVLAEAISPHVPAPCPRATVRLNTNEQGRPGQVQAP